MTIPATTTPTASLISPVDPADIWQPGEPTQLGILASGNGSNFEAVAEAIAQDRLNAKIQVLIYNNPEAKVAVRAANYNVPAVLLDHRCFPSREDLDRQIVQTLKEHNVSWVVMAGWMRIVTPVLIDAFAERIINIHPSLLPSFRGIRAVEQALAAGVKISGCTVHVVVPEVDSGCILLQAAVPVLPDDTPQTLHQRIHQQEYRILPAAIALAARQRIAGNSQ